MHYPPPYLWRFCSQTFFMNLIIYPELCFQYLVSPVPWCHASILILNSRQCSVLAVHLIHLDLTVIWFVFVVFTITTSHHPLNQSVHTRPPLSPSLASSFLINGFMISGSQQRSWKRRPNLYSCHLIFRFPSHRIPVAALFSATWQHLYSEHASICLSLPHETSHPWRCTLSVYTPAWVHLKLHSHYMVRQ